MVKLKIKNKWFIDDNDRIVLLRGLNLGGSSKVPFNPNGATHLKTDFSDHRDVSFIGRPFFLKEADEHYKRIKHWGFNCLRFLIIWEAIEHRGPKKYDNEYLDYLEEVLKIAENYGFYIIIDPHQDVWSRMTGGDGAPCWIFEKIGLDFTKFNESEAAILMQNRYDPNNLDAYPHLIWPNNAHRFANGTMWTLFFGGKDLAPSCKIDGINVQDYLQDHYIEAIRQVALRVKDYKYIIGFDTLNEPQKGWIGKMVNQGAQKGFSEELGHSFTPFDAILTGSGHSREVGYTEIKISETVETRRDILNKNKVSCWVDENEDIWKNEGVWGLDDDGEPIILKNDFFTTKNGKNINFYRDYLVPFIMRYSEGIQSIIPEAIIFFEGPEGTFTTKHFKALSKDYHDAIEDLKRKGNALKSIAFAAHWYDIGTYASKTHLFKINKDIITNEIIYGEENVQNMFINQLSTIKSISKNINEGIPTLIGEFGLIYNLNNKKAFRLFKRNPEKAWAPYVKLLNMYYNAMDANILSSTQWNYTADNCNEWGDLWNLEDFSIFSRDQQNNPKDINSGGRAIKGFCRPHFIYCAGIPLKMEFNIKDGTFNFKFEGKSIIKAPTTLYVPDIHYPNGYDITSQPEGEIERISNRQLLNIYTKKDGIFNVKITKNP